ncbi:hypothetical protein PHABIO_425 [Pseudomonas phage Phabio]|uniref:Uncharacterized protein n=1 Tax=Pseudomonas phage Phabio TaxID=2006668 RepID=A0A1Y0SZF7_9CAUD|nr:hypothetical protein MZD05_gp425 [Pseudomonas phage Phabio]ARV77056.1 hypothetical protein PHABIO_425 [Pseudomonas phage Phabio]
MNSLKLYLCQPRFDLMTDKEKQLAPEYDCYRGYVIAATSQEEALYNCPRRDIAIRDNTCEGLLDSGLPVFADEYNAFIKQGGEVRDDNGQVLWTAKSIGLADMSQYKLLDIVISDFKAG